MADGGTARLTGTRKLRLGGSTANFRHGRLPLHGHHVALVEECLTGMAKPTLPEVALAG